MPSTIVMSIVHGAVLGGVLAPGNGFVTLPIDSVRAAGAVRLSVGMMTTSNEVSRATNGLIEAWRKVANP
ncbi:MAG TPA: hypothetical protein VFW43_06915 [Polaromonas sp.]|nr:hypothetical protein [Polaromonas sp.]